MSSVSEASRSFSSDSEIRSRVRTTCTPSSSRNSARSAGRRGNRLMRPFSSSHGEAPSDVALRSAASAARISTTFSRPAAESSVVMRPLWTSDFMAFSLRAGERLWSGPLASTTEANKRATSSLARQASIARTSLMMPQPSQTLSCELAWGRRTRARRRSHRGRKTWRWPTRSPHVPEHHRCWRNGRDDQRVRHRHDGLRCSAILVADALMDEPRNDDGLESWVQQASFPSLRLSVILTGPQGWATSPGGHTLWRSGAVHG